MASLYDKYSNQIGSQKSTSSGSRFSSDYLTKKPEAETTKQSLELRSEPKQLIEKDGMKVYGENMVRLPEKKTTGLLKKFSQTGGDLSAQLAIQLGNMTGALAEQIGLGGASFLSNVRSKKKDLLASGLDFYGETVLKDDETLTKFVDKLETKLTDQSNRGQVARQEIQAIRDKMQTQREKGAEILEAPLSTKGTFAGEVSKAIGGMIPQILAKLAGAPLFALSLSETMMNVEDSLNENIENGMDREDAVLRAMGQGAGDFAFTYITNRFGALNKMGGAENVNISKKGLYKTISNVAEYVKDSGLEVAQEVWQTALGNMATDKPFTTGLSETAKISLIPALFFGGVGMLANAPAREVKDKTTETINDINQKLADNKPLTEVESQIYLLTNGENPFTEEELLNDSENVDDIQMIADRIKQTREVPEGVEDVTEFLTPEEQADEAMFQRAQQEDDLIQEAKRYKSAEEFVKSIDNQGDNTFYDSAGVQTKTGKPVIIRGFHGTDKQFDNFVIPKEGVRYTGDGIYFYPNEGSALSYASGKKGGRVMESYIDLKNPYNMYLPEGNIDWQPGSELLREIKVKGHDGIIVRMKDTDTVTGVVESDLINEIVAFNPKSIKTKSQLEEIWKQANEEGAMFQRADEVTTKILKDLEGRNTVSKQYILDATNRGEIKQQEKDIIRQVLDTMPDGQINVKEFADKVKSELLPLDTFSSYKPKRGEIESYSKGFSPRYESITLPDELRGKVANYKENIYQSPIKTSAGNTHFSNDSDNYFGHTRIEDMADNKTRRIIEVQSDLFQRGRMEKETEIARTDGLTSDEIYEYDSILESASDKTITQEQRNRAKVLEAKMDKYETDKTKGLDKLQQYSNPTAHFRMVREEIKKASDDGIKKLQFPTGETAMKIEGLGSQDSWSFAENLTQRLTPQNISVGQRITQNVDMGDFGETDSWVVIKLLDDGKFKAIPEDVIFNLEDDMSELGYTSPDDIDFSDKKVQEILSSQMETEQFDISGKVDTNNPIYRFYEKDLGRYLKSKYNAELVTDNQGVDWYEVAITPDMGGAVEAFQKADDGDMTAIYGLVKLREYQERLGIQFPVKVYEKIYTGEISSTGKPVTALGMFLDNQITLAEFVQEFTADHEMVHFALRNIKDIPVFEGLNRGLIFEQLRQRYLPHVKAGSLTREQEIFLEEKLATDFEEYVRDIQNNRVSRFKGQIKSFFDRLYEALLNMLNITQKDFDAINKFYNKLYFGKNSKVVTFQNTGKSSEFMNQRFQEFGEEPVMFQKQVLEEYVPEENSMNEILYEYELLQAEQNLPEEPDMPEVLQAQLMQIETIQTEVEKSPFNEIEKYVVKSGKLKGELPEVTGQTIKEIQESDTYNDITKSRKNKNAIEWIQRGDDIIVELFGQGVSSEDVKNGYQDFLSYKDRFKQIKADYRQTFREYKLKKRDTKALQRILNKADKDFKAMIAQNDRYNAFVNRVFQKGFKKGEAKGIVTGKVIAKAQERERFERITRETELKQLREGIVKRLYVNSALQTLRSSVPRDEWGRYMTRLTQVGLSEKRYLDLIQAIGERKQELDEEEGMRRMKASERQKIGYLKHVFDIEPSLILSIKKDLNIKDIYKSGEKAGQQKDTLKSIKDYNLEELALFTEELKKRIDFRKENKVNYLDLAKIKGDETFVEKVINAITSFDRNAISVKERNLKRINPSIYYNLMALKNDKNKLLQERKSQLDNLFTIYDKISEADQETVKLTAQSGKIDQLRMTLEQYATEEEVSIALDSAREVLNQLQKEFNEVGIEVPYRQNYFPRKLKPMDINSAELLLRQFEYKMGRKATQEERTYILNNLMRGFDMTKLPVITLSGKKFETQRLIETITPELSHFYEDFKTATLSYVLSATEVIEQRKFFGKQLIENPAYEISMDQSIGAKVYDLYEKGLIKQEDIKVIQDIFKTEFIPNNNPYIRAIQNVTNDLTYALSVGQVETIIRQVGDLSFQLILDLFEGQFNLFGSQKITLKDLALDEDFKQLDTGEINSNRAIARYTEKVLSPLMRMDKGTFKVTINATARRLVKSAKENNPKLLNEMKEIFGKEKGQQEFIKLQEQDVKNIELSEEMKLLLFIKVSETRPTTSLQKTMASHTFPFFYTLKTFMLKQLDFVRRESLDIIADGVRNKDKKQILSGVKRLMIIMSVLGLMGAGVEELIEFIRGKNKTSFFDKIFESWLKIVGLNNYMLDQGQALDYVTPAGFSVISGFMKDAWQDVKDTIDGDPIYDAKVLRRFPLIGGLFYYQVGGGS